MNILTFLAITFTLSYANLVHAQTSKSDTKAILDGMAAMDAAGIRAEAIQKHFANKNYDMAIGELNMILQSSPTDSQALLFRALAYYHEKHFDAALADLKKIKPDPMDRSTGRMYALKAKIYQEKGNRDAAITEAILGINSAPEVGESFTVLEELLSKEQYVAELSKAIGAKERYIGSHYPFYARRASYYIDSKMYEIAVPDVVNALKRNPDDKFGPWAWSFLDFYFKDKRDAFLVELSSMINASKAIPTDALARRAHIYLDQKKFDLAVTDASRALNARSRVDSLDVARLFAFRAYAYAGSGKYDLAITDLDRLIASKFYKAPDFELRSQIYCLTGRKAEAKEDEKKVVALGGKVTKPCL